MIAADFEYSTTTDLTEALKLVADGARPLAGGMSLVPIMKLRLAMPDHLVDIARIPSLNYIRRDGDVLRIGATTTHHQVESSPELRFACPLLPKTASQIGDIQVRNMGTIGGSVAHADPAADYPAALFALEARVRLLSAAGERELPLSDFILDTFTTAIEPGEIVAEVIVPADSEETGTAYLKAVQPASGFAIVGVAVRLRKANGKLSMVRVGVTGLGPLAYRANAVEDLLLGTGGTDPDITTAAAEVANGIDANGDLHASAEYRKHLARVYTARALRKALVELS